jgi:hypothetical protein
MPDINHPSMGDLFDQLRLVVNSTKSSILLLQHLNRRGEILGSIQIWNKPDNVLELQGDGLVFYKVRGNTPNIVETKRVRSNKKDRILPFYSLSRDRQRLIFNQPINNKIKELFKRNGKNVVISNLVREHGLSKDTARKRVERIMDSV